MQPPVTDASFVTYIRCRGRLSVRLPFSRGRCVGQTSYRISSCDRCPQTLQRRRGRVL